MDILPQLRRDLGTEEFTQAALRLFRHQARHCAVYREWLGYLQCDPESVHDLSEIPYLPIDSFRFHRVLTGGHAGNEEHPLVFSSSGTTGLDTARHYVADEEVYRKSLLQGFAHFFGSPGDWTFLFLLPSYLDRPKGQQSSLVWMCEQLREQSRSMDSGFFLDNRGKMLSSLRESLGKGQKTMLLGVSFALLDLAESGCKADEEDWSDLVLVETGGMKGRRREMLREELHARLGRGLGLKGIYSEYGMTELLSQSWSSGRGKFRCPPWMKVSIRDPYDPFQAATPGQAGGINVIDLANVNSCAFVATNDLGRSREDGSFEVLGRFDHSVIRGCNLLVP